jgi:hypothetical protein
VLLLREIEQRLRVAERLAGCIRDPRDPDLVTHTLADIMRFRLLMIGAGYEDGNDASALRSDPIFKMAQGVAPSERELASQSTISRFENLPDARALLRMGRALVDLYCASFQRKRTPGAVHSVGLKFQGMSVSMFLLGHRLAIRSRACCAHA